MARARSKSSQLPSLKWLLAGALAAGIWVVREEMKAPRPPELVPPARTSLSLPRTAELPPSKPSRMTTSSIVRPDKPLERAATTLSRVKMRAKPDAGATQVTMLEEGRAVRVLDSAGKWREVVAGPHRGWVHGDYLGQPKAKARAKQAVALQPRPGTPASGKTQASTPPATGVPRPKMPVAQLPPPPKTPAKGPVTGVGDLLRQVSSQIGGPSGRQPLRQPQGGDCQCPYDLMLDGSQCGEHSAYVMRGPSSAACYR